MRGVTYQVNICQQVDNISTHTPHARCDPVQKIRRLSKMISTHTPHARCDGFGVSVLLILLHFYSHTSCEVWRFKGIVTAFIGEFLLTHLMRGVTPLLSLSEAYIHISTHTPHARCDAIELLFNAKKQISTHTPHARCDQSYCVNMHIPVHFYSHTSCEVWPLLLRKYAHSSAFLLTHLMRGVTRIYSCYNWSDL